MTVKIIGEGEILREVSQVLVEHLSPAKVVRFWAGWQTGRGAYLQWREERFAEESVATLSEKVLSYQAALPANANIR